MGYHFRIEYKPGNSNRVADALSRVHEANLTDETPSMFSMIASYPTSEFLAILRTENSVLAELVGLHQKLAMGKLSLHFSVHDGLLMYRNRFYIGVESALRVLLLREFHSTPIAGHAGVKRTLVRLATNFYWQGI